MSAGVSGAELTERSLLQAEKFRLLIVVPYRATELGSATDFTWSACS